MNCKAEQVKPNYGTVKPPKNADIIKGPLGDFWLDENGFLVFCARQVTITENGFIQHLRLLKELTKDKQVCILQDLTCFNPIPKSFRERIISERVKAYKAIAVVSASPMGKMVAASLNIPGSTTPIGIFKSEAEAKKWITQFL
ncbi:MAG TPA: hypothetical protein VI112_16745 [Bacteroidia bacterium]|jgi:hypothetical protein